MLEFFRNYQRYFFIVIAIITIASFSFFGTFTTFGNDGERGEELSEVQQLSRFLSAQPNFCNDGVIQNDFLQTKIADLLVESYFDALAPTLSLRLEKAKRFRPYVHPEAPFLSAKAVWDQICPKISEELEALKNTQACSPAVFGHFSALYLEQGRFSPEMLRKILIYQHKKCPWLQVDQRLAHDDLSLFGYHSDADWFGNDFVDLVSQFILTGAELAEEKGYKVSLEEAKGDLIYNFSEVMDQITKANGKPNGNLAQHLRSFGFDDKRAVQVWRKVLLFRRYFQDVSQTAFVDRLPYRDFAGYAKETAVVQKYEWATQLNSALDAIQFQLYQKAVCKPGEKGMPTAFNPIDQVEKSHPDLVVTTYLSKVASIPKKQVGLRIAMKDIWEWELDESNWATLRKEFSFLKAAATRDERFQTLEKLEPRDRAAVDTFCRGVLVEQHPTWIEEALANVPVNEETIYVPGSQEALSWIASQKGDCYFKVEQIEKIGEKEILTFDRARDVLAKWADSYLEKEYPKIRDKTPKEFQNEKGEWESFTKVKAEVATALMKGKNLFQGAAQEALAALQKDRSDTRFVKTGSDPLLDQFKFVLKEEEIQRTSQEDWMKEQAFIMGPDQWSPVHVAEDGQIAFFYLQEKKQNTAPILDQLLSAKQTLAADAQRYLAERLLETAKKKNAIVIPLQKESDE